MSSSEDRYFTSKVLNSTGVRYAFLGRFSKPEELNKTAQEIFGHSTEDIITINQVHGNSVVVLEAPLKKSSYYKEIAGDAIVTALGDQPIAIRSADCLPILLYDQKNSVIGAAHAGWR
ncbi:MAG: polyphenol oxidase family protein, partial [Deltaproteobacteria bacterium]|nr:polyphenol oxidase family protein [Deltaproteobacteria bacterium]